MLLLSPESSQAYLDNEPAAGFVRMPAGGVLNLFEFMKYFPLYLYYSKLA
jgi:hypothetical protein